jgi:signal transduction histidine kinase
VYRYRLSGIDRSWVESRDNSVQYTALSHDDYEFEVSARNEWGVWSEPAMLRFSIAPPFWKTWWFIALVVLVVGGAGAAVVTSRVRALLAVHKLRTKIAADLHDDIGAGLTEISIASELVSRNLPDATRTNVGPELERIGTRARELVTGMSDIVWLVDPSRDSLRDLVARLGDSFRETLRDRGVDFTVTNADSLDGVRLPMERRQHVFLILKEAVHNAVKHSAAQHITLDVTAQGNDVRCRVRDDGVGFDRANATPGNGLGNMSERARRAGCELDVRSATGEGTTVTLTVRS